MDKLREIIRELVRKELAEATTTGDIAGYETPHAFTGGPGKGKKKKKEIATNSTGYNVVKEDVGYIGIDTKPHKKLDGSRFAVEGRLGELRKWTNALNSTLDKETKSKKYSKMIQASFKKDVGNFAKTVSKVITVAGKSIKESVNSFSIIIGSTLISVFSFTLLLICNSPIKFILFFLFVYIFWMIKTKLFLCWKVCVFFITF